MKKTLLSLPLLMLTLALHAGDLPWTTDLPAALKKAQAEKKQVLLHFTGSDWCGFCIKQKNEVFSTKEFADYAARNFVLVEMDFPNKKSLPAALKKANNDAKTKYGVKGFPALIVLKADGTEAGRKSGYPPGSGPKAVIAALEKSRGK